MVILSFNDKGRQNQGIRAGGSNFQDHKESLSKVDEIYDQVREKHGSTYTLEKLRMWAQMIRLGNMNQLTIHQINHFGVGVNVNKVL